jgi:putative peptidoglycan lipid II flippase
MAVMMPAAVGSGMLQIATFTDLYFASFIPGAAAALGYAILLVMAPLGSSLVPSYSLCCPSFPVFHSLSTGQYYKSAYDKDFFYPWQ